MNDLQYEKLQNTVIVSLFQLLKSFHKTPRGAKFVPLSEKSSCMFETQYCQRDHLSYHFILDQNPRTSICIVKMYVRKCCVVV